MSKINFKHYPPTGVTPVDIFTQFENADTPPEAAEEDSVTPPVEPEESDTPAEPVRTDAGLIDPETGAILEPSLILRKFGWTEWPDLPKDPTPQQLDEYEAKLDQVVDLTLTYRERIDRYRKAAEYRCTPIASAAEFYERTFLVPMARRLAPHRLPRYKSGAKKGEYRAKTLALASGAIRFRKRGGPYVHDAELLRAHIDTVGVEQFAAIGAVRRVSYDYRRLISALEKGVLKDLPGTGYEPIDPLGSVTVVAPGGTTNTHAEKEEEEV